MAAVGRNLDEIDVRRVAQFPQRRPSRRRGGGIRFAHGPAAGVQQQPIARLRILQLQQANRRQFLLAGIGDAQGDEIVPSTGALERLLESLIEKITQQENDGAAMQHAVEVIEPLPQRRATVFRLVEEYITDETQDVACALARRHEALDAIGELHQPDAVIVADGAEASTAASSAATSRFCCSLVPNWLLPLQSTASSSVSSRSSMKRLTNGCPMRAVTFQSMARMSSPG